MPAPEKMKMPLPMFGLKRNVLYAGLVSLFMDLSSEMVYPLVPLFLTALGASTSVIGLVEGIAESTASLLKVVSGKLSDRLGNRKHLMIAGYGLAAISRPVLACAGSWYHVLAGRFIDRIGKGIRSAPRDALIKESTETTRLGRSFGFHRAMDTTGAVLGPATAFFLLSAFPRNYRMVFWLSMVPALIAVMIILFRITENKNQTYGNTQRSVGRARASLNRNAIVFIAITALFSLGNSSDAFLILKAQHSGISTAIIPVVYLVFNLVYAVAAIPSGIAADRFGARSILIVGFLLFAGVYYGFGTTSTPAAIWILFCLYGIFMGLTEGVQKAYLGSLVPDTALATAFGLHGTVVGCAVLPASLIAGWLWDHVSPSAPFYFGALTAATASLLLSITGQVRR